jgi:DNA repair protein radc
LETVKYHPMIREMPENLRPRERLLKEGVQALTDIELLAILLRTGSTGGSVLELAAVVLNRFRSLRELLQASIEELSNIKGIGPAKAAQVKAALELGRRVAEQQVDDRAVIRHPEDVVGLVMEEMRNLDREQFRALLLNTKHQLIGREIISIGTLNSSMVHPRELFKSAIKRSAAAMILVHNHPSGDPAPSQEDIGITKRMQEAGSIIGIEILDHLIVGDNRFVSFKAKGLM